MRHYICLLLFHLTSVSFSQGVTNAVIEYKIYNNTAIPNSLDAILFIKGSTTIYLPKYSTKARNNEKPKNAKSIADWHWYKTDHSKKELLFFEGFGSNAFLIADDYNKLDWEITGDIKDISGYQCIRATLNFRGRDWEAWFTPDIPLPYGPWKFYGLPGLIMEVYDSSKTYTIRAEKIDFKEDDIFKRDFKSLVETRNTEPMPIRQFLKEESEFHENADAEYKRRHPTDITVNKPKRVGYELEYEWETE